MTVPADHDFHDFVKAQNRTRQGCWIQWMLNANLELPTPDFSPTMSNHHMQRLYRQHILRTSIRSRSGTLPSSPHPTTFRTRHAMSFSESSENRTYHRSPRPSLSPIAGSSGCIKSIEKGRKVSPEKPLESRNAKKDLAKAATLAACLPDNEDTTENESENEAKTDVEEDRAAFEVKEADKKPQEAAESPEKMEEEPLKELAATPIAQESQRTRRASTRLQKLREMKDKLSESVESSKKLPVKRDIFGSNGSLMPSRKARSTKKSEEKQLSPSETDEPFEILDELSDVKKDPEILEEAKSTCQEKSVEKSEDVEMVDLPKTDKSDNESSEKKNTDKKLVAESSKVLTRKRNSSENSMGPISSANSTPVKMPKMTSLPVPDLQLSKKLATNVTGTPLGSSPIFSRSTSSPMSPMSRSPRVGCLPGLPASKISAYLDNFPLPKLVTAPNPVFIPTDIFPGVIDDEPVLTDEIYDILEDLKINPPKAEIPKIDAFENIPTDDLDVGTLEKLEAAIDVTDLLGYEPPKQVEPTDVPVSSTELPYEVPVAENITADLSLVSEHTQEKQTQLQVKSFPVNLTRKASFITIPLKMPESPINVLSKMLQKMMQGRDCNLQPAQFENQQSKKTTTIAVRSIAPITTIIQVDSIEKLKKGEAVIGRRIIQTGISAFAVAVPNSLIAVKHKETTESKLEEITEDKMKILEIKEDNKKVVDKEHSKKEDEEKEETTGTKNKEETETNHVPKSEENRDEVIEEAQKEEGPVIYTSPVGHRTRSLSSGRVNLKPKRRIIRRKSHSEDDKENASKKTKNERKATKAETSACLADKNVKSSPVKNLSSDDEQKEISENNNEKILQKKCSVSAVKTITEKDINPKKEQPIVLYNFEASDEDEMNEEKLKQSENFEKKKENIDSSIDQSTKTPIKSEEEKQSEAETRARNKKGRFLSNAELGIKNEKHASKKEAVQKAKDEKPFTPRRSSRVSKPRVAFDNPNYYRRSMEARDLSRSLSALVKKTDKIHAPRKKPSSSKISKEKKNAETVKNIVSKIKLDEVKVKPLSDCSTDGSSSCSEEYLPKSPEAYCPTPEEKVVRARRKSTVKKSKLLESRERAQQRAELKAKKKKEREEAHRALLDKPPPGPKPFKCRYCRADFMTKSGIHYHQKLATCEATRCPFFIL